MNCSDLATLYQKPLDVIHSFIRSTGLGLETAVHYSFTFRACRILPTEFWVKQNLPKWLAESGKPFWPCNTIRSNQLRLYISAISLQFTINPTCSIFIIPHILISNVMRSLVSLTSTVKEVVNNWSVRTVLAKLFDWWWSASMVGSVSLIMMKNDQKVAQYLLLYWVFAT